MGNANGKVYNDTNETVKIYVFNYADGLRNIPRDEKSISPGETVDVEALPHGSGLIVATGRQDKGNHYALGNGRTVNVSTIQGSGGNPWHGVTKGIAVTTTLVVGSAATAVGTATVNPALLAVGAVSGQVGAGLVGDTGE